LKNKEILKNLNLSSFVAFDFETTGLDPLRDRIIEVAAIRFEDGIISERFVTLVNPERNIPTMITEITGISNSMVQDAPKEGMIIDDLLNFLDDDPLVAHNINFDHSFLKQLCKRHDKVNREFIRYDTLQLSRSLLFEQPVFNLSALAEYYSLSSEGAHRAEKDTENTGEIFLKLLEEIAGYPIGVISKIIEFIKGSNIPNQQLYIDLGNELTKNGNLERGLIKQEKISQCKKNTFIYNGSKDVESFTAEDVFGTNGLLSGVHPNFESRYNQAQYSQLVDKILSDEQGIGVIEAGTGLGKSMAYLYGAIKQSKTKDNDSPIVIACHTKHLQDQLFHKDLPLLSEALDVSLKAVMLKGRKNYICKTRLNWLLSDSRTLDEIDIEALIPVLIWMHWTETGDLAECSGFLNARRNWLKNAICSDSGFCTGDICSRYSGCYYGRLKKVIFQANIIIVNHSLLMTDLNQKGLLPNYHSVVVDEAHNLIKSAYDQFKIEWSESQVLYHLQMVDPSFPRSSRWNNILNHISDINPEISKYQDELKIAVKKSQQNLREFMEQLTESNRERFTTAKVYQDKPILGNIKKVYASIFSEISLMKSSFQQVFTILDKMKKSILEKDPSRSEYPILHAALDHGVETISGLVETIILLTENQDSEWVYWMEGDYRNPGSEKEKLKLTLNASLIDVSGTLSDVFFKNLRNCVLTSATIKVQDSFDYFLGRTGLDQLGSITTKEYLSPFLYNEQVNYYQYGGSREISNDPKAISDLIFYLNKQFSKRIMVLFTSIKALSETAKHIRNKPGGRDLPLFAQVRGASKPAIIKAMHQNPNGILFGTNSFWEGVDLPGDLLEILVLVKLPFDVPSEPLIRSYSDFVNKMGGNSFMEFSLPEAAIRFRQGFGRLIRTSYDEGKFLCLDNRIVVKRYGEIFSQSLPLEMKIFSDFTTIR